MRGFMRGKRAHRVDDEATILAEFNGGTQQVPLERAQPGRVIRTGAPLQVGMPSQRAETRTGRVHEHPVEEAPRERRLASVAAKQRDVRDLQPRNVFANQSALPGVDVHGYHLGATACKLGKVRGLAARRGAQI